MSDTGKSEHRYTLAEINRMRAAERTILLPVTWVNMNYGSSPSYNESNLTAAIEERIRTYMQAGIRAEDVEAAAAEQKHREAAQRLAMRDPKDDLIGKQRDVR